VLTDIARHSTIADCARVRSSWLGEINSRTKALHNFLGDFVWGEPVQTHGLASTTLADFCD
jgi:hypothetical protein